MITISLEFDPNQESTKSLSIIFGYSDSSTVVACEGLLKDLVRDHQVLPLALKVTLSFDLLEMLKLLTFDFLEELPFVE